MAGTERKRGRLELKFNLERTQALATIFPPLNGGEAVSTSEVLQRLKTMGVTFGIREQAILNAVHQVEETGMAANNIVVAQSTLPEDGQDALIAFELPRERLARPLPRREDFPALTDWFRLNPANRVVAGQELATVTPAGDGPVTASR